MSRPVVAVDLDGTIAEYDGWQGEDVIGDAFPGAVHFLTALKTSGFDVVVFSARAGTELGVNAIWAWLNKHGVANLVDEVTNVKQYRFAVMVDDRAIRAHHEDDPPGHFRYLLEVARSRCGVSGVEADDVGGEKTS